MWFQWKGNEEDFLLPACGCQLIPETIQIYCCHLMAHGTGIGSSAVSWRWEETVAWAVWLMATDRKTPLTALQVNCCTLDLKPTYGEWPSDADLELHLSSPSMAQVFLSLFSSELLQIFIFSFSPPFALAQPGPEDSRQESFSVTLHPVLWRESSEWSSGPLCLKVSSD